MGDIDKIMQLLQDPSTDLEVVIRRARPEKGAPVKKKASRPQVSETQTPYQKRLDAIREKEKELARRERQLDYRDSNPPSYGSSSRDDTNYHN